LQVVQVAEPEPVRALGLVPEPVRERQVLGLRGLARQQQRLRLQKWLLPQRNLD
jgi:hypothetical protein